VGRETKKSTSTWKERKTERKKFSWIDIQTDRQTKRHTDISLPKLGNGIGARPLPHSLSKT